MPEAVLLVDHLCLQVILDADFFDQVQLRFQPVDVLFGIVQDVLEQFTRYIIAAGFTGCDAFFDGFCASFSSFKSQPSISGVFSPIINLCSACRLGKPSNIKMRSISLSACFISPMDSSYSFFAIFSNPQCLYMRACRKYWLIAVSSLVSCASVSYTHLTLPTKA